VIEVRLLHRKKAASSMLVTLSGMVIEVRLLQKRKAPNPMLVTPSGMVIEVRLLHPEKASSPMLVTGKSSISAGITNSPSAHGLQLVIVTSPSAILYQSSPSVPARTLELRTERTKNNQMECITGFLMMVWFYHIQG